VLVNLPVSGTYTVVVLPYSTSVTATLYAEAATTLTAGTPITVTTVEQQNAAFRFSASTGTSPGLSLAFSPPPSGSYSAIRYVYKPDGTLLTSGSCTIMTSPNNVCSIQLANLPVSGTYNVVVLPYPPATLSSVSITATLSGM
jgi:hypothetical protein